MQLIEQKWRNENEQFKPGFCLQLELKLKVSFPETDLCAYPRIESNVKLWKRHYYAMLGMLQTSGFRWNDTDKIILVDNDQVWENYLKKDLNAKGLRNKHFPQYDDWCVLFSND